MANVTEEYPNSPTPYISVSDWDFDPGYNLSMPDNQAMVFTYLNVTLNTASMLCGSIVCIILLMIRAYRKSLVDRVSLRLTAAVSAVDVIKAAGYVIFTYVATPGISCRITAWLVLFLTNLYTFLSVAIAFNLQWIFLLNNPIHKHLEVGYFTCSLALALATTVPPLVAGRLGYDPNYGSCWFISFSSKRTIIWEWATFLSWNLIGSIYCFLVVISVIIRLRQNVSVLGAFTSSEASPDDTNQQKTKRTHQLLRKLVLRISLYALIPIVTQGGWFINEMIMQFQHRLDVGITYWVIIGTDLPGILNLIAFCMDPALSNALRVIELDMIEKYGDKASAHSRDHTFKAWIIRTIFGVKRVHSSDSLYYRMSIGDNNLPSSDSISNFETEDISLTHYPIIVKSDLTSSRGSITDVNQGSHRYEIHRIGDVHDASGIRTREKLEDEKLRSVFRGL